MKDHIRRSYKHKLKNYSKNNRVSPTKAERIFRDEILKKDKTGYRFLRQKPLDNFIMDFYCPKLKLCIEIDGGYHDVEEQKDYDDVRENILNTYDIKIIRYTNKQVFDSLDRVKIHLDNQLSIVSV
jgi:very-short-patch-repair endonuclease